MIYDDKYVLPNHNIRIGNTAQEVIDRGIRFTQIDFGDREFIRCELAETKQITGKMQRMNNLQLFFDRKIYQRGSMRNVGANATLQSILIGDKFDIRLDTLTEAEKDELSNLQRGKFEEGRYVNKFYGIKMDVPSGWTYHETYWEEEDFVKLCCLNNEENTSIISLNLQENSNARDGEEFLDRLGYMPEIECVNDFQYGKLYRQLVISKNNIEHEVYYSININGNSLLLKGNWISHSDLKEIENVILTLRGIKAYNVRYLSGVE
jgi:hypothetical protein